MDPTTRARLLAASFVAVFTPVFALPLLLHPYRWAKAFGWREEPVTDVGLYFGRCLGAVAVAACAQGTIAATDPVRHRSFFRFMEFGSWLLAAVHVRGLLERRQPPSEHAEIVMYSAMGILARKWAPPSAVPSETARAA